MLRRSNGAPRCLQAHINDPGWSTCESRTLPASADNPHPLTLTQTNMLLTHARLPLTHTHLLLVSELDVL